MKTVFTFLLLISFLTACDSTISEEVKPLDTAISTNKYVAIGNSYTAGYMNGGLYRKGQELSYPNLIAQQMGVKFEQPLFAMGQENGTGYLAKSGQSVVMVQTNTAYNTSGTGLDKYSGNNNNLGIPFLRMSEVEADQARSVLLKSKFYPFFERIANTTQQTNYLELVKASKPTFYTLFLGEQDVLAYASSGGTSTNTELSVFATNLKKLLDVLASQNAYGVMANIPDITKFSFLGTLSDAQKLLGQTDVWINTGNGIIRKATNQDNFLMAALREAKKGNSEQNPLPNETVLDQAELLMVQTLTKDYNAVLQKESTDRNIPIVDLKTAFEQVIKNTHDSKVDATQFFSLDNTYPTPRGNALIANEFIKVINQYYKKSFTATIPSLDVSKYSAE